ALGHPRDADAGADRPRGDERLHPPHQLGRGARLEPGEGRLRRRRQALTMALAAPGATAWQRRFGAAAVAVLGGPGLAGAPAAAPTLDAAEALLRSRPL